MSLLHCPAGITPSRASGAGRGLRRAGTLAAALLGAGAAFAPAADADTATVTVAGDSVLITNQTSGPTTVQATRPDAVTHRPVVIGQYADVASSLPFSVNTTVPTPLNPNGDCWQKGALASALTPDLQPGDTVTVTQTSLLGSQPTSTSVPVTAAASRGAAGPIPACRDIAPFARNAVTRWPDRVAGGPIVLSGVAQPFAKRVSVSAIHGRVSTAPVAVSPAQDGTWSATIPAGQVDRLAGGALSVTPVFEVPDVRTGATAHIAAGATVRIAKSGRGGASPSARGLAAVHVPARVSLRFARRKGIRASFVVPGGARVVRVQLKRGGKTLLRRVVPARKAGSRQTVRLRGPRLRRVLQRGRFRVTVSVGPSVARLGAPVSRAIVIR
jgi:hypothetical protein